MNMGMKTRISLALLVSVGLVASAPAYAGVAGPAPVTVQLTIENSCTFAGTGTLNFGTRTAGNAATNIDAQSTGLSVTCAADSPSATINVNAGANPSGAQRRLKLGTGATFVSYDLYSDPGRLTKLDPTGFQALPGGLVAGTRDIPIYGRIPQGTVLPFGGGALFTDTVQVTINF